MYRKRFFKSASIRDSYLIATQPDILEIKRNQNTKNRLLDSILKELKIYPMRFSKYCIGLSLLETKVKNNRFKPVIHQLRKKEIIH
jgi:hypothetical protein